MVSMDELVNKVRHTRGVKQSTQLMLDSIADRVAEIANAPGEAPGDRVAALASILEYVQVIRNNADILGGAISENQRVKAATKKRKR